MSDEIDYSVIRKRVEKRIEQRQKFFKQVTDYLFANIICWVLWYFFTGGNGGFPWPLFVTFFGGLSILNDAAKLFFNGKDFFENMRQREFEREVERERARMYTDAYEKPKRDDIALSDDGELVYSEDEEERRRNVGSLN